MGRKALKLGGLGALAAAMLLAGCNAESDGGRVWAMTSQEDYYPDNMQAEQEPAFPRDDDSTAFMTREPEWGTGGAGEAGGPEGEPIHDNPGAWASNFYSELVPGAETGFWHPSASAQVGTGKPLKAVGGIWVQGLSSVEQGALASQFMK
jgi:hypothetical protein